MPNLVAYARSDTRVILSVSLNTALDKTLVVPRLTPGTRHTPDVRLTLAAGKAVNAARSLRLLGEEVRVVGFIAGDTGAHIEALLAEEGTSADWIRLPSGESRTCVIVVGDTPHPTEFNEPGPRVRAGDLLRLERAFLRRLPGSRFVLFSGRLAPGVPAGFYARLIGAAAARGVPCALDTSEPALGPGLRARPDIVKPNRVELEELGLSTRASRWRASLERLAAIGAGEVFATLGEEGALMLSEGRVLHAVAPPVRGGCPIGCGDTFLAGAVYGRLRGWPADRRLRFATALASAGARTLGAGLFRRSDLRRTLPTVRLRRV